MAKKNSGKSRPPPEHHVVISYEKLGTIHPKEQMQAILADINTLTEQCGEFYLTGAKLTLVVTNEWGDPVCLHKNSGERLRWFDTNHYVPACRDYEL